MVDPHDVLSKDVTVLRFCVAQTEWVDSSIGAETTRPSRTPMHGILGQRPERTSGTDRGELRILRFTKFTHMATIVCASCLKEVSDKVIRCPNCGQPLPGQGGQSRINLEGTTPGTGSPEIEEIPLDLLKVFEIGNAIEGAKPMESCGFCGRRATESRRLIPGRGVAICSACVASFHETLAAEKPTFTTEDGGPAYRKAGRLCTEISNAMVPLSTHQQLLADKWNDPVFRDSLKGALASSVERITRLLNEMRLFLFRRLVVWDRCDDVDIAEVVAKALRLTSAAWKDKVRIEQKLAERQTVWADENKLVVVLMNLLQNSIAALEKKSFENEQPTIWIEGRLEAGKSILVVRDNGIGIRPEHLDRVFAPLGTP